MLELKLQEGRSIACLQVQAQHIALQLQVALHIVRVIVIVCYSHTVNTTIQYIIYNILYIQYLSFKFRGLQLRDLTGLRWCRAQCPCWTRSSSRGSSLTACVAQERAPVSSEALKGRGFRVSHILSLRLGLWITWVAESLGAFNHLMPFRETDCHQPTKR